jgi:O-methyltransferase involved in polyketide biosynthesis
VARIGPTAHYTGHVWGRHGLSHPELDTAAGRLFHVALAPSMAASRALGGPTLEAMLLARHRIIDALLSEAIESGEVTQVIEVAAGMSPRGWRFAERYGDRIEYVDADLPDMAARKRRALAAAGSRVRVEEVDVLHDDGPRSVAAVAATLDRGSGLAIVTEGLLSYFPTGEVRGMWRRFARVLGHFAAGLYLSDLHAGRTGRATIDRAFMVALSTFVGAGVRTHFEGDREAVEELRAAGFAEARLHRGESHPAAGGAGADPGARRVQVVEART